MVLPPKIAAATKRGLSLYMGFPPRTDLFFPAPTKK
jgi:hypothetical protein